MTLLLTAETALPINATGIVVTLLGLLIVAAWLVYLYR
jgi:hypothetical protein